MTESLFDTAFEQIQKNDNIENDNHILPPLSESGQTLINYRLLISSKESGCLIGQNGQVINSIRQETNTKAGISKLLPHTNERILTVSGLLDNCAKAISYFAQALIEAQQQEFEEYNYFPLRQLSVQKNVPGETTCIRLLIPNSQMGTIIGSKGIRIQKIQQVYGILMIALKLFLPGSNERLVELQGSVNGLYESLRIISRCLIEDFGGIVSTNYYIPRPKTAPSHQLPHASDLVSSRLVTTTVSFPNDIVGALIGKNGSRIQGVRKILGAIIGISDELERLPDRIFTISGTTFAVEKAKSLLYHNLDREQQRRAQLKEYPVEKD